MKPDAAIERIYVKTLSRKPTDKEVKRLTDYVAQSTSTDPKTVYSDILWAVLNSSEFALNH